MDKPHYQLSVDVKPQLTFDQAPCNHQRMVDTQQLRDEFVIRLNKALDGVDSVRKGRGRNVDLHALVKAKGCRKSTQATHKWLSGESMPEKDNMRLLADACYVRAEWLEYGDGPQYPGASEIQGKESNVINADFSKKSRDGEIVIPHHDVRAAMGEGQILPSDYIETIRHVTVSLDYLRTQGVSFTKPENLGMITGFGESMNKTFASGDPLMIDRGVTTLQTDGVYMFTLSGALFVKRLQMLPNGVRVISDNDAYPPYDITGSDLKGMVIHARVLLAWRSQRL